MTVLLKDVPIGATVMTVERMDGEVRKTVYRTRKGEPRHANFIPVYRLRCQQGIEGQRWRYSYIASKPLYPSEAHGLTPVVFCSKAGRRAMA